MPRFILPRALSLSAFIILTLGLFPLGGVPAAYAQTPVVEATNSSDETVLQILDDGGLLAPDPTGTSAIPATGAGTRLMWFPEKYAFRAGRVSGSHWDADSIGSGSVAFGSNTTATHGSSVAMGSNSAARGYSSVALGASAVASGRNSVAIGDGATAINDSYGAFALGEDVTSTGGRSVAIGYHAEATTFAGVAIGYKASTGAAGQGGMILNADYTASGDGPALQGTDQFAARATHFWFGDDNNITYNTGNLIETSTGAYLSDGGDWTNHSDSTKKELYRPVDGEALLGALRDVPVRTWSYKAEPDSVRHMGPTAQDFHAAFGLGSSDKAISTVDIDGVNMRAVQALEARTTELQRENDALRETVTTLEERVAALESQHSDRALAGAGYAPAWLIGLALVGGLLLWRRRKPAG